MVNTQKLSGLLLITQAFGCTPHVMRVLDRRTQPYIGSTIRERRSYAQSSHGDGIWTAGRMKGGRVRALGVSQEAKSKLDLFLELVGGLTPPKRRSRRSGARGKIARAIAGHSRASQHANSVGPRLPKGSTCAKPLSGGVCAGASGSLAMGRSARRPIATAPTVESVRGARSM
jgi:hypothetical protein